MDTPLTRRIELTRSPALLRLARSRWPQFIARAVSLAGFVFTILAGLFGSPVGSHNFAILFVWIAWWTALKVVFIPLGGRAWCSICPIPMPGEWLQQGFMVQPGRRRGFGLNLAWPKKLRGAWLQTAAFLAIGLFSAVTLTTPSVTGWVFLGLILTAVALSLVFQRRAFCQYVCPMGGFIGWYARIAPLELRIKDRAVCNAHLEKTCFSGCAEGVGCPWGTLPPALRSNSACGLCMECLRTCPRDNVSLRVRPFAADLKAAPRKPDEAGLGIVLMGCVLAFAAVFQGSWGALKTAAFQAGSPGWFAYAGGFLALTLGLFPGLFALAVWAGRRLSGQGREVTFRAGLAAYAYALLPLGFCGWLAFTLSFALAKFAYVWPVLSDPLGRGWDLFGTAHLAWTPYLPGLTPLLVAAVLLGGLLWSGRVILRTARENLPAASARIASAPLLVFALGFVLALLWILV